MLDIAFDIVTREIVMENNDFATTTNPSDQNAGILLNSRCAFLGAPMFGIGLEETMNASGSKVAYEMNRWKSQAMGDGATIARWTGKIIQGGTTDVFMDISYL